MIKVAAWKPTDLQWHYDCRYVIRFLERLRNLIFSNNSYYVPNYGLFSMTHKSCFEKQLFNSYNCRSIDFRLVSNVQLIRLLRILAFPMYIFKLWGGGGGGILQIREWMFSRWFCCKYNTRVSVSANVWVNVSTANSAIVVTLLSQHYNQR